MRVSISIVSILTFMCAFAVAQGQEVTKATYMITGLHCPPCTRTVESSLAGTNGVTAVKVDRKSKSAKISFDESKTSAQKIAELVSATPHMMGGRMSYSAQLALSVPDIKDEASAKAAKEAITAVPGIESVATFPRQHTLSVRFSSEGNLTSSDLITALEKAGFKSSVY